MIIVFLAMGTLGQVKRKNLVLCFTRSDQMWGKEDIYGPLAQKLGNNITSTYELSNYLNELRCHSDDIKQYLFDNYAFFYNAIFQCFRSVGFVSLSSLGSEPVVGSIPLLAPSRVLDPILWTLKFERHL